VPPPHFQIRSSATAKHLNHVDKLAKY